MSWYRLPCTILYSLPSQFVSLPFQFPLTEYNYIYSFVVRDPLYTQQTLSCDDGASADASESMFNYQPAISDPPRIERLRIPAAPGNDLL